MATISFTIPDDLLPRITIAVCGLYGYPKDVPNPEYDPENPESSETISNPQSKTNFIKQIVLQRIKRDVLEWEGMQAQKVAYESVETDIKI